MTDIVIPQAYELWVRLEWAPGSPVGQQQADDRRRRPMVERVIGWQYDPERPDRPMPITQNALVRLEEVVIMGFGATAAQAHSAITY